MMDVTDRQRGALIGLAVGDALGAAVEFMPSGSFPPVTDYRGGGPHGLEPGEWTDDTSMALALADSIASTGWDLEDQLNRYIEWWQNGKYSVNGDCFDIGTTTQVALATFRRDRDPFTCGLSGERSSGNGSNMRLAPVPIRFYRNFDDDVSEFCRLAEESSLTTHASDQCRSACRYLAAVLAALIRGDERQTVLSAECGVLSRITTQGSLDPIIEAIASGSYLHKSPPEIRGSGSVVESLEAALWAFHSSESFAEAVLKAVNLGNDADTTGAVCGQLAGAWWGESGIPENWRTGLARRDLIEAALRGLLSGRDAVQ
jgi:ADP-ribosyl-[dinitrogen reductase] hydrolase